MPSTAGRSLREIVLHGAMIAALFAEPLPVGLIAAATSADIFRKE